MHSESANDLRFPASARLYADARISYLGPVVDAAGRYTGEHRLAALVGTREIRVRYIERSGEFELLTPDAAYGLSSEDLQDLATAIRRYQQSMFWSDADTPQPSALSEPLEPSWLAPFQLRSASDLGEMVLLAGDAAGLQVDVVLQNSTGELALMLSRRGTRTQRRAPTSHEAHDLVRALKPLIDGRTATRTTVLIAVVIEAASRCAVH